MKKALLALGLLWSAVANAQFTPGQLLTAAELNTQFALYAPLAGATFTGPVSASAFTSTPISGSTGSFTTLSASSTVTLPAGSLPLTNLATQAANTIVANGTGSTASPTAISAPSCSTPSSALQWTSGTGLACNSAINASSLGGTAAASYALLASPTFTGTPAAPTASATTNTTQIATTAMVNSAVTGGSLAGSFTTLASSGNFTPSQTNGIVGTTTNNNANAGSVGEFTSATTSSVSLTTATPANVTSISLTAGDWDVSGVLQFTPAGTTVLSFFGGGASSTSATLPGFAGYQLFGYTTTGTAQTVSVPTTRFSLSATTTIFLVAQATFTTSTCTVNGFIRARRVR